jgi:hypothetical protein
MNRISLRCSLALPLALCLCTATVQTAAAQMGDMNGPPKVLVIDREFLKPGKAGSMHEKSEGGFIRASNAAKSKSYYFGMDSLSGPPRSLFFFGYPSFAAWEKDNWATRKNTTFAAALDHASNVDGELLSAYEQSAFNLREDLSLNMGNLVGKRYMEISQFVIRPGHGEEAEELIKMYMDGYKKAAPNANWATFEVMYGYGTGDVFLFITTMKSLAEADQEIVDTKHFMESLGEKGRKRLGELSAACLESAQTNLFELNPKISYPPEEWIKAEPDFWKPKAAAPAKKAETKPVE